MYDTEQNSAHRTDVMPGVPTAALASADESAEATLVSLDRLRSAVVELSTALHAALRDELSDAAASLQRANAMLRGVDSTPPQVCDNGTRQGLAPWQLRRVLAHIEANLDTPIRNKDLATVARLSTFYFNVAFRNSVGEPPHGYIIRRRVERAQGLMLSTTRSLSDIASECGLADQSHLTRIFRRLTGVSPGHWRRTANQLEPLAVAINTRA